MTDEEQQDEKQEQNLSRRERRAQAKTGDSDESVKDRNQRLRSEAASRRRKAREAERDAAAQEGLDAGERVDDALVRSADVTGRFVRDNFVWLQWIVIVGFVGAMGYLIFDYRKEVKAEKEGARLAAVLGSQFARLSSAEPQSPADSRLVDPRPEFDTEEERAKAALDRWGGIKSPSSDLRLTAALGKANALYDLKKYKEAREAFQKVAKDPSAKLLPAIQSRALEGVGLGWEAEGVYPEALKSFEKLKTQGSGFDKELGAFHVARVQFQSGDKDKALEALSALDERLSKNAGPEGPKDYLGLAVRDLLMTVDPIQAVKEQERRQALQMQEMLKQFQEMQKQKGGALGAPGVPGIPEMPPTPMPTPPSPTEEKPSESGAPDDAGQLEPPPKRKTFAPPAPTRKLVSPAPTKSPSQASPTAPEPVPTPPTATSEPSPVAPPPTPETP